jgi:hypothetical protein
VQERTVIYHHALPDAEMRRRSDLYPESQAQPLVLSLQPINKPSVSSEAPEFGHKSHQRAWPGMQWQSTEKRASSSVEAAS